MVPRYDGKSTQGAAIWAISDIYLSEYRESALLKNYLAPVARRPSVLGPDAILQSGFWEMNSPVGAQLEEIVVAEKDRVRLLCIRSSFRLQLRPYMRYLGAPAHSPLFDVPHTTPSLLLLELLPIQNDLGGVLPQQT